MVSLQLEIRTPERTVYEGEASSVQIPTSDGLMGVLPRHAPLLADVGSGLLSVTEAAGGAVIEMTVHHGFVEVGDNQVRVVCEAGELPDDLDAARADDAEQRARERLKGKVSDIDIPRARASLQRAIWRKKLLNRRARR
jgi:F-type H+-transporting ATPase subunit epsilon